MKPELDRYSNALNRNKKSPATTFLADSLRYLYIFSFYAGTFQNNYLRVIRWIYEPGKYIQRKNAWRLWVFYVSDKLFRYYRSNKVEVYIYKFWKSVHFNEIVGRFSKLKLEWRPFGVSGGNLEIGAFKKLISICKFL